MMTPEQYARLEPVILKPGERIAFHYRPRPILTAIGWVTEDGKELVNTTGEEVQEHERE